MIRVGRKADVYEVVPLIVEMIVEAELSILATMSCEELTQLLQLGFQLEDYRYSYKNAIVLTNNLDETVGVAFGYPGELGPIIDQPFTPILVSHGFSEEFVFFSDRETFQEEWYLDIMIIKANQRRKGYGKELLQAILNSKKGTIGLNCAQNNPQLLQFYASFNFKTVGSLVIGGHRYNHMQVEV